IFGVISIIFIHPMLKILGASDAIYEYCYQYSFILSVFTPMALLPNITLIRAETKFGNSRLDFYLQTEDKKIFAEVKGVTLEENGIVRFPDAPTERGIKHLNELCAAVGEGYEAYAVFVVQMSGANSFEPNDTTHPAFGAALRHAAKVGVHIVALGCKVTPDTLIIENSVKIKL
ncbi:MAG: DNA/RNA nuclease SfsA, partial [Oscillospiraceae bacterium]